MKTTTSLVLTLLIGGLYVTATAFSATVITDDFEPDIDWSQWRALGPGAVATNSGGSISGTHALVLLLGERFAATRPRNTMAGGRIEFYLRFADRYQDGWWHVHLPEEGVALEYSTNGGSQWAPLATYDTWPAADWAWHALAIPSAAQSYSTQFRWRQLREAHGDWALDDVVITVGEAAPVIVRQPECQVAFPGGTASFSVEVLAVPLPSYQWQCNGAALAGETNAVLQLSGVTASQRGNYSVEVSNSAGVAHSATAPLAIAEAGTSYVDDFEAGLPSALWQEFGGTVLATNYGGSVSGSHSLWFGGESPRFASTRPLDTQPGGWIDFYLRLSNDDDAQWWSDVSLPMNGIILEYSVDAGAQWTGIAAYRIPAYFVWTHELVPIPTGALSPGTQFRWRQLQEQHPLRENWALDDVIITVGPTGPIILAQPVSLVVAAGGTARFGVSAGGTGPFTYQWQFDDADLAG